jgi:hypothetical protein
MPVFDNGHEYSEKFYKLVNTPENDIQRMEARNFPLEVGNIAVFQSVKGMIRKMNEKGLAEVERIVREAQSTRYEEDVIQKVGLPVSRFTNSYQESLHEHERKKDE